MLGSYTRTAAESRQTQAQVYALFPRMKERVRAVTPDGVTHIGIARYVLISEAEVA